MTIAAGINYTKDEINIMNNASLSNLWNKTFMMNLTETKKLEDHIKEESRVIATRKLYYSVKGNSIKHELIVRLYAPVRLRKEDDDVDYSRFHYASYVEFSSIYGGFLFYGYDALQAIELAAPIDLILREKENEYDFYFTRIDSYPLYFDEGYVSYLEGYDSYLKEKMKENRPETKKDEHQNHE